MLHILTNDLDDETQCTLSNLLDNTNQMAFDTSNRRALFKKDHDKIQDQVNRNVKFNKKKSSEAFLGTE